MTGEPSSRQATFAALWAELDAVRERRRLSRQALAFRAGQLSGRVVPAKTLHDRMANGRRVPWDEMRAVVAALGLPEQDWRSRWEQANDNRPTQRRGPSRLPAPVQRPADGPATRPPGLGPLRLAQLPRDPDWFTGRQVELEQLLAAAVTEPCWTSAVPICVVEGMAGIGKTALAVRAGHRLAEHYPDGQLFIDLRGFTSGKPPVEPVDALGRLLHMLGISGQRIPVELDDRASLWRGAVAGRRMLFLLDNAATEEQVRPLLPGMAGCLVLITSRRRLVGLEPTHFLSLETLPVADAVVLFADAAGQDRLANEPGELVTEAVELCGRLPLAVRVAATRLRYRPSWSMADLVARLHSQDRRLAELSEGDEPRSVIAALDLSYEQLSADQQQLYLLLALHPGLDIDPHGTAALGDLSLEEATWLLEQLLGANLLQELAPGRYGFHDLVRAHAIHTVTTVRSVPMWRRWRQQWRPGRRRRAALTRLLDYYRHTASVAMDVAHPYERERRPRVPSVATPIPVLSEPATASAWLDTELPNLLAVAWHAADNGWPEHAVHLSAVLHRHLRARGYYRDAEALHRRTLEIAPITGHQVGELDALFGIANAHRRQGRHDQALHYYRMAFDLARATGHRTSELDALAGLGFVHLLHGQYEQAIHHYQQKLEIARSTGHRTGELGALAGLGAVDLRLGRHEQALHRFQQALELVRSTPHRTGEIGALAGVGGVHLRQGQYDEAIRYYRQALGLARSTGHRAGELDALTGLGHACRRQGHHEAAADHYRWALEIASEIDNRNWQFEAEYGLGRLLEALDRPQVALHHYHRALDLATHLQQPANEARACDGLAHAYRALKQLDLARQHWRRTLDILEDLSADQTEDGEANASTIRAQLVELEA